MSEDNYCYLCQEPESAVGHVTKSCPNVKCKKCSKKGHVMRNCPNLNLNENQKLQTNTPRLMDADVPDSNYRELSIDAIDFAESIEFPCEFKLKTEIKQEGECSTDNMKSETIIRPKFEPRESLNGGQSEIKGETTSGSENCQFSPKVEVKDELTESKKETDDEFQNGISVMEKMDDSNFNGETFTNDSLPQQNLPSPSDSENSQFDVDPNKSFQCPICPIQFGKKGTLKKHISTVHEDKSHKCPTCSAVFSQKTGLKYHMVSVHEGKKPNKCSKCEASFAFQSHLRRHRESVHEGKKSHKCPICKSSFAEKSKLRRHMESVHEGKKSHKCPICESSYSQKSNLRQHMEAVHEGKKSHKCPICESSFARKSYLTKHFESVHEGKERHK